MKTTSNPTAKFQLFQQIDTPDGPATIIGIEYVEPLRALLSEYRQHGYSYRVSHCYGASVEELIRARPHPDSFYCEYWEEELLQLVQEVAA